MTFKTTSARTIGSHSEPSGNRSFAARSSGSRGAENKLRKNLSDFAKYSPFNSFRINKHVSEMS